MVIKSRIVNGLVCTTSSVASAEGAAAAGSAAAADGMADGMADLGEGQQALPSMAVPPPAATIFPRTFVSGGDAIDGTSGTSAAALALQVMGIDGEAETDHAAGGPLPPPAATTAPGPGDDDLVTPGGERLHLTKCRMGTAAGAGGAQPRGEAEAEAAVRWCGCDGCGGCDGWSCTAWVVDWVVSSCL